MSQEDVMTDEDMDQRGFVVVGRIPSLDSSFGGSTGKRFLVNWKISSESEDLILIAPIQFPALGILQVRRIRLIR